MQAFTSNSWLHGEDFFQYLTSPDGREMSGLVYNNAFWEKLFEFVKAVELFVHVLRIVDGDNCPMAKIYEAMNIAKEAIANFYNNDKGKYKPFWDIIDQRWNNQVHRPMREAAHQLNPRFVYAKKGIEYEKDTKISLGFHDALEKLVPNLDEEELICNLLAHYYHTKSHDLGGS